MNRYLRKLSVSGLGLAIALLMASCATPPAPAPVAADCPQPKFAGKAPPEFYSMKSPITAPNFALAEKLYFDQASDRYACATCHGRNGDGKGPMSRQFTPLPRHLSCVKTAGIPEGQVFWTIRNGSPGTDMPGNKQLTDEQIWQLVAYIRNLSF